MKVTREKTENSQAFLTVEMEPAEVEEGLAAAYRRLVKKANIPGFRKGKAPRDILERHLGRDYLLDEALNQMIPDAYEKALAEQEIEAYAQPDIELVQPEPVIFKAVVPLKPTVELGAYKDIRVTVEPVEVTEENIDNVIEQLRHQNASWEPVERPVQMDDLVTMNINGQMEDETLIDREGYQNQVVKDQTFPAPGFGEKLEGMAVDEEREFEVDYPEDYPSEKLAGKKASFKVKVTEIKEENMPELNDEFVQTISQELKTVAELREEAARNLKIRAEERVKQEREEKAIAAAVEAATVTFPPVLTHSEIHRLIEQQMQQWQMDQKGLDEYLKNLGKTEEELHEELRPTAEQRVARSLVLSSVAEAENVEVTDADIDAEIERMCAGAQEKEKEELVRVFNTPQYRTAFRQSLMTQKTVDRLVEIAGGEGETAAEEPAAEEAGEETVPETPAPDEETTGS